MSDGDTGKKAKYVLTLYVCGMTYSSEQAVANVCQLFESEAEQGYDLQIIDVLERPDVAERERIFATPTLIKERPLPREILIGDLSTFDKLKTFLGLPSKR